MRPAPSWAVPPRRLLVVEVVCTWSLVDVGDARHLHAVLRCLLVQILERILVEVDGRGAITLRRCLLNGTAAHLVSHAFEPCSNLLSR